MVRGVDNTIELTIDALTYGGRGVGRFAGKAVFVPSVLPGERVLCRIVRDKKRYCEAELVSVLQGSVDRRTPPCPLFPECGGCQWQHLPYALQLHWKQRIFTETLVRTTACDPAKILPIIAADTELAYRCRTQIKCRRTPHGFVAGFYATGSHRVVDVDRCLVLDPHISPLLDRFKSELATFAQADKVAQVDFCVDSHGQTSMLVHFTGSDRATLVSRLQTIASSAAVSIYLQEGVNPLQAVGTGLPQSIHPQDDKALQLQFPPGGFIQINLEQNQRMVREVLQSVNPTGQERILDLYSGVGNFSLPLARVCSGVLGVEEFEPAVAAAITNARNNGLHNAGFIAGRCEQVVERLAKEGEQFDTVVLDPPRTGASRVVASLLRLRPRRIVYVSCDPTTLARDLVPLLEQDYQLRSARPIDMFPQTWHIEGVAVLEAC